MNARAGGTVRVSARLRLALSYAIFLVAAGAVVLVAAAVVLYYVPNYPLAPAIGGDSPGVQIGSRGDILRALLSLSALVLIALALIGAVGGWILAGWILRPLKRINEAAEIVATGDLQHRVRLSGRNDEFRQLADNVDTMLNRLHDSFEQNERFAANASHELRTPLAVTATLIDVARRDPDGQDYAELLERLKLTNDRAIGLTEALLRLADANAVNAVAAPIDLAEIARAAMDESAAEAVQRGVELSSQLQNARAIGDAGLLHQLVANLVQNAIRHGGGSGTAAVSTRLEHAKAVLQVTNDGPVISPERAARFAEPFLRGSGRISVGGAQGYGLGLALVARITDVHAGTLLIVPRTEGGLTVTVELPASGVLMGGA